MPAGRDHMLGKPAPWWPSRQRSVCHRVAVEDGGPRRGGTVHRRARPPHSRGHAFDWTGAVWVVRSLTVFQRRSAPPALARCIDHHAAAGPDTTTSEGLTQFLVERERFRLEPIGRHASRRCARARARSPQASRDEGEIRRRISRSPVPRPMKVEIEMAELPCRPLV